MATDIIARGMASNAIKGLDGKANLVNGKVPASELPSYVDDVEGYETVTDFPEVGEQGKIYVARDTGYTYRWDGEEYVQIGGQDLSEFAKKSLIASAYDNTSTYAVGDLSIHDDTLYKCNTPITTPEEWNSSHWTEVKIAGELKDKASLSGDNTFSGSNTFSNGALFGASGYKISKDGSLLRIEADGNQIGIRGTTRPIGNGVYDLGNSSNKWKDIYLSGKLYNGPYMNFGSAGDYALAFYYNASPLFQVGTSNVTSWQNILPSADGAKDLGSSSYKWQDLYLSRTAYFGSANISADGQGFVFSGSSNSRFNGNVNPYGDNSKDLGTSSSRWKDIYLAGSLKDGTNTLSIADIAAKQDALVSGTNIKTINGSSVLGAGNLAITTYQAFPNTWVTNTTTKAFCASVDADASAIKGMAYLGELTCSDLPFVGNADAVVEVIDGSGTSGKVIHIILTSGNIAPYRWECTYWNSGVSYSGWIAYATMADLPQGDVDMNLNDTTTTVFSTVALTNIVTGNVTDGYTKYALSTFTQENIDEE